jgi:hypothetical protein
VTAYAGVGSRRTPPDVLELMELAALTLRQRNFILRSGHARGADQAFEAGAGYKAETYLPWPTFESDVPVAADFCMPRPAPGAYVIAAEHHPAWPQLSNGAKALHARNSHQILGRGLGDPVRFVICWAPLGAAGRTAGGTGQAIRVAEARGIPVFNLVNDGDMKRVATLVDP